MGVIDQLWRLKSTDWHTTSDAQNAQREGPAPSRPGRQLYNPLALTLMPA
jgi:hypothetical protein